MVKCCEVDRKFERNVGLQTVNKRLHSTIGLLLTCLGFLIGSVAGCSGTDSQTPPHDPVESRKVKADILKGIYKPGKAKASKSGKSAPTAEDRF
jgi:hypothetical protein